MTRAVQGGTQHGADAAGADDADSEASRAISRRDIGHERSSPLGVPDICNATRQ